jgi:hypothetical protein
MAADEEEEGGGGGYWWGPLTLSLVGGPNRRRGRGGA